MKIMWNGKYSEQVPMISKNVLNALPKPKQQKYYCSTVLEIGCEQKCHSKALIDTL
jgi:hypothetical protein